MIFFSSKIVLIFLLPSNRLKSNFEIILVFPSNILISKDFKFSILLFIIILFGYFIASSLRISIGFNNQFSLILYSLFSIES